MSMCIFEVALNNTRNQFCSLVDVSQNNIIVIYII